LNISRHNFFAELPYKLSYPYKEVCDISCDGRPLGLDYCNYRYCHDKSNDFRQSIQHCNFVSLQRNVKYELRKGSDCVYDENYYRPKEDIVECEYVPRFSIAGAVIIALVLTGLIANAMLCRYIIINRESKYFQKSDPTYLYMLLFGASLMEMSAVPYLNHHTDTTCLIRPWLLVFSAAFLFIPLLMKLNSANEFVSNWNLANVSPHSVVIKSIQMRTLLILTVEFIILIIWTVLNAPHQDTQGESAPILFQD
jgi:hypothetical protein